VGAPGAERQITNVADGTENHDAVNLEQLNTAIAGIDDDTSHYFKANGSADATASGMNAVAAGVSASASGSYSTAVGSNAYASGTNATAVGSAAQALGKNSVAMGYSAKAAYTSDIAIGNGAQTTASRFTPQGYNAAIGVNAY